MKIVGVLGGSFNPIHNGHLSIAKYAHEQMGIPEILIMPTASTYYKDDSCLIPSEKRMDMIRLAISENEAEDYMKPSYLDINRGGITYTYDTINDLKKFYDKIYFIIGADSLMYIDKWKKADEFLPQCILLTALREGISDNEIKDKCDILVKSFGAKIILLDINMIMISSSEIRKRIRKGQSVNGMLPDSVLEYITENSLYI